MDNRAIVLANGDIGDAALMRARLAGWEDALVIGADAGSHYASLLGLRLDVAIGDFDSLGAEGRAALEAQGVRTEAAPVEKDETDLELALLYAAGWGAIQIVILGATGGRIDMNLANMLLLAHPELADIRVELWHGRQTAWLIRPPGGEVHGQAGDTVSLIAIGGRAADMRTDNFIYPLHGETLPFGPARGVSNIMTARTARIMFSEGLVLAVHTPGRA